MALDDHELADTRRAAGGRELVDTPDVRHRRVGGRWVGESIGRPYELPDEMAYCRDLAAVAAARLADRLGDRTTERRIVHNTLLAGVGDDGCSWFYSSPLSATHGDETDPWHHRRLRRIVHARAIPYTTVALVRRHLLPHQPHPLAGSAALVAQRRTTTRLPTPWPRPRVALQGHPRNEAAHGCVAVELGPFVMCAEEADVPGMHGGDVALQELGAVRTDDSGRPVVDAVVQPLHWDGPVFGGRERRGDPRSASTRAVPLVGQPRRRRDDRVVAPMSTTAPVGGAAGPVVAAARPRCSAGCGWRALVSNIGTTMHTVGAAWAMTELSDSPAIVSLVQTAWAVPGFLVAVPAGVFADVIDRRTLLLVCQLTAMLFAAALGVLEITDRLDVPLLLARHVPAVHRAHHGRPGVHGAHPRPGRARGAAPGHRPEQHRLQRRPVRRARRWPAWSSPCPAPAPCSC